MVFAEAVTQGEIGSEHFRVMEFEFVNVSQMVGVTVGFVLQMVVGVTKQSKYICCC